jgi:hypothetical protein
MDEKELNISFYITIQMKLVFPHWIPLKNICGKSGDLAGK